MDALLGPLTILYFSASRLLYLSGKPQTLRVARGTISLPNPAVLLQFIASASSSCITAMGASSSAAGNTAASLWAQRAKEDGNATTSRC